MLKWSLFGCTTYCVNLDEPPLVWVEKKSSNLDACTTYWHEAIAAQDGASSLSYLLGRPASSSSIVWHVVVVKCCECQTCPGILSLADDRCFCLSIRAGNRRIGGGQTALSRRSVNVDVTLINLLQLSTTMRVCRWWMSLVIYFSSMMKPRIWFNLLFRRPTSYLLPPNTV
jgi:hypothetical protein